jgi:hypothetical protein
LKAFKGGWKVKLQGEQKWKVRKITFQLFIVFIACFLLNACTGSKSSQDAKDKNQQSSHKLKAENWKLPMDIPEGEFFKVAGWYSKDQILYITNQGQTSSLYTYDLISGKSELLFKNDDPIVTAIPSPTRKYILIQSSPSSYEGVITIIDRKGGVKWEHALASYELEYAWNPYNESEIMVSKFNEDWTFKVFKLDMKQKELTELSIPQPFVKWIDHKRIAYLNWDQNKPALVAPLIIKDLSSASENIVSQNVFQFSTFKDVLLTITVNDNEETHAIYSFFNEEYNKAVFSFSIPQLTKFSDWLVPYNDFNTEKQQFLTFQPIRSGEADTYSDGFQLVSYHLKTGKSAILLEGLKNEPLSCSPTGETCLYGGQFEKLIDLKSKKIMNLIKE